MTSSCTSACADKLQLIYFSPTSTTRRIVEQIAAGLKVDTVETCDLTHRPDGINACLGDGVAIIGTPVYAGRVPEVCLQRLQNLTAVDIPAIIVVLYGNREFEDALVELRDVVTQKGFRVIAAGGFIGEHSYSTAQQPIAANRPDQVDLQQAFAFGEAIAQRLRDGSTTLPDIPGNVPYKERPPLGGIAPETDPHRCTLCGACARACPTEVITVQQTVTTDAARCILCCACTRSCPTQARFVNHLMVTARREMLVQNYSARKQPSLFL